MDLLSCKPPHEHALQQHGHLVFIACTKELHEKLMSLFPVIKAKE